MTILESLDIFFNESKGVIKIDKNDINKQNRNNGKERVNVEQTDLPYPSLTEVNYLPFDESNEEPHNELYGFIKSEQLQQSIEMRDFI